MMNFRTNGTAKSFTLTELNPLRRGHKTKQMSDLMMSNERRDDADFDLHPEGSFMAVCRDIWVERKPNPKYPGTNPWGNPEPEQLVKVCIDFLTDEPIEINGKMMPRFMRFKANLTWGEKGSLRDFVSRWNPAVGREDKADLEQLVGTGAYLTIVHNTASDGKVWANVKNVSAPPKGASIPMIPANFVRHKDKAAADIARDAETAHNDRPAPKQGIGQTADDLPF